jgi:hypothetical protein
MKTKILVGAFLASLALFAASAPADADPVHPEPKLMAKKPTTLTLGSASAVPGEKKTFDVSLADAQTKPLAGKTITLSVVTKPGGPALPKGPISIGSAQTGTNGHAVFTWSCADVPQGAFELQANYAGDGNEMGSSATANFFVAKAQATFSLGDLMWGTYKNEPGNPNGTIMVKLNRTSDQKALDKKITITVNGKSWPITLSYGFAEVVLMPLEAKSWDVKVQFDGDDYTVATGAERHYTHP